MYVYYLSFLFIFSQNNIYTNNSEEKRCKKNSLIFLHLRIFIISIKLCLNCICVFPLFYLQIYASMPASSSIFFKPMVKNCDYTSDSDHCHHRSKPDSDQMSLTDQSDCDRDTDVEEVKTVFGKSHTLMYRVCDRLHSFRQVDLGMPPQIPESLPKTDSETL